jgi:hypothetical protein
MNPQYNLIQYSNDDYKITNENDLLIKEFKSRRDAVNWLNDQLKINSKIRIFKERIK